MFIAEGTLIDDRYEVITSIGMGGMGVVYEAKQLALDRVVAFKLLSFVSSDFREEVARFEREAYILSRLQHVNIVQFYAFGIWQNFPYIVMERIFGVSLQKKLAKNEPLPTAKIIDYAEQICAGLQHAHSHSVFHRDVKPSNVIISNSLEGNDVLKLIDFGLAKLADSGVQKLTQTNTTLGSVMYMSPEQCVGNKADARSDIYSLGCVLYHCFTGEPPYCADNAIAIMFQQTNEPVETCRRWTELPEPVQAIIARCMFKDPAQRYQSCSAVRDDLTRLAQVDLHAAAPSVVSRPNVPFISTMIRSGAKFGTVVPIMLLSAICLAMTFYFVTQDHTLAKTEGKATSTGVVETHKEMLTRFVRHAELPVASRASAKQLSDALHHCAQDATINPNVLLMGYQRLLVYYQNEKDSSKLRSVARDALYNCRRATDGYLYSNILIIYHRSCDEVGCGLSLSNELECVLMKFPEIEMGTKTELSLLLASDHLRLGNEKDAKAILDKIEPVRKDHRDATAKLRQACQKVTALVGGIQKRRQNHQGAVESVVSLSSVYLELGDPRKAISVLQAEMPRTTENTDHDLLRLRLRLAGAYMSMGDYEKAEVILGTILKPLEEGIGRPDWPHVSDEYSETAYFLCFCYLRVGRYAECADLGDRWAQHRNPSAQYPSLREEVDVRRANAYRHVGRFSDAEKIYKAIAVHTDLSLPGAPENYEFLTYAAMANSGLACIYYHQASYDAALKHAEIAVKIHAKTGNALNGGLDRLILMQCLEKLNRTAEALVVKEAALKQLRDTPNGRLRSFAYMCDDIVSLDSVTSRPLLFSKVGH